MIRQYQLVYKRLMTTKFPDDACREAFIKAASCKKEATRLDNYEECKMCIPVHHKGITVPDEITDLTPISGVPADVLKKNIAIITKPAKNVMQQGTANTEGFVLKYPNDITWGILICLCDLTPISGVPADVLKKNIAIITKPAKNVMQQGTANTEGFVLKYPNDITWENPLMGWISGANSLKDVEISFPSKESAVSFAQKNGFKLFIPKETPKKNVKRGYSENFAWDKRTRVSTK